MENNRQLLLDEVEQNMVCVFARGKQINNYSAEASNWCWDTDKSRYFAITEFNNIICFIIQLPICNCKKEKSMVLFTPEQNIICSQTQLNDIVYEQPIICRQLFAGHVVSS